MIALPKRPTHSSASQESVSPFKMRSAATSFARRSIAVFPLKIPNQNPKNVIRTKISQLYLAFASKLGMWLRNEEFFTWPWRCTQPCSHHISSLAFNPHVLQNAEIGSDRMTQSWTRCRSFKNSGVELQCHSFVANVRLEARCRWGALGISQACAERWL